jgi:hypothetical protein
MNKKIEVDANNSLFIHDNGGDAEDRFAQFVKNELNIRQFLFLINIVSLG